MGGRSSSTTQASTSQQDNRNVLGNGSMLAQGGSSVSVTTLDGDVAKAAIASGTKNLDLSLNFAQAFGGKSFDFAKSSMGQALDSLKDQSSLVKDAYADAKGRGALTDKILIGAIAMSGLVAIAALRK